MTQEIFTKMLTFRGSRISLNLKDLKLRRWHYWHKILTLDSKVSMLIKRPKLSRTKEEKEEEEEV